MSKTVFVLLLLAFLLSVTKAGCPFSTRINVTWDTYNSGWVLNGVYSPDIYVAGGELTLFNITSGSGVFFLSTKPCDKKIQYALTREDGVTNNACIPPCTITANFSRGLFYYCSSLLPKSATIETTICEGTSRIFCPRYTGCGQNGDNECKSCFAAKSRGECSKISGCSWCPGDGVCLHENSGACRGQIEIERSVASWVWLLITLCAFFVLIAVIITLFISEHSFQSRWAAIAKTDKDFAEVGKGANDGLMATD